MKVSLCPALRSPLSALPPRFVETNRSVLQYLAVVTVAGLGVPRLEIRCGLVWPTRNHETRVRAQPMSVRMREGLAALVCTTLPQGISCTCAWIVLACEVSSKLPGIRTVRLLEPSTGQQLCRTSSNQATLYSGMGSFRVQPL